MLDSKTLSLLINRKKYSFEELKAGYFQDEQNSFEKSTLTFCHEWLSGKDAFTLTTSGSTGTPKQITLLRSSMEASARGTESALRLQSGFTALLCLDPHYIAGQMMLVRSFITGMNIVAVEPASNPFAALSSDSKIDFTALVPFQLKCILSSSSDAAKLNSLQSVLIGGAELDFKTRVRLNGFSTAFYETYGMTETISHIALKKCNRPNEQLYFQVLPGIQIAKDERGCLVISADYLGKEKIITNDLVEILSTDKFVWLGRFDTIINTGGVKVIPEKVEKEIAEVFLKLQLNNRFFLFGQPDSLLGNKVVLFVEGGLPAKAEVLEKLKLVLNRYEMPKEIKIVSRFIETETQKVNRKATSIDDSCAP